MPKKKRTSTWGSKRKRGENSWELRWPNGGHETFHGTAKEADRRLAELRIQYEGATPDITLDQFWSTTFHSYIIDNLAKSTVAGYENYYYRLLQPEFGDSGLRDITSRKIQSWLLTLTVGNAKHARALLRAILSKAFVDELVDDNAAQRRFKMPTEYKREKKNKEAYTRQEFDQILAAVKGEVFEPIALLSGGGGAAREEAMGAKPSEVRFDTVDHDGEEVLIAYVPIVRGVQYIKKQIEVLDHTKNDYRKRDLIILPPYSYRLKEIVDEFLDLGYEWFIDDGYGNPLNPDTVAKSWERWFKTQPFIAKPIGDLRHTYNTHIATYLSPHMAARIMGHSQINTNYSNYYKPTNEHKLDALMGNYGQITNSEYPYGQ